MRFMLLQDWTKPIKDVPLITEWAPEEVEAHAEFQRKINRELRERGELVEVNILTSPDQAKFVYDLGDGSPVVTDGPYPEGKEMLAGYRMIDVESLDRALEIAARTSAAPGPGGEPIGIVIEVREVMGGPVSE